MRARADHKLERHAAPAEAGSRVARRACGYRCWESTKGAPWMPKFVTIGYGDRAGYDRTDPATREAADAHDERLRAAGALIGIAGEPVQVRNPDGRGLEVSQGAYLRSDLPIAGFAILEAPAWGRRPSSPRSRHAQSPTASSRSGRFRLPSAKHMANGCRCSKVLGDVLRSQRGGALASSRLRSRSPEVRPR